MTLRHLKQKEEFKYQDPDRNVLDTFPNPGVDEVTFKCLEFTSLCPITGQPDYGIIEITYKPMHLCIESKSLKLYLGMYRQYGGFAEQITKKIYDDICKTLKCETVIVKSQFSSRGGISLEVKNGRI